MTDHHTTRRTLIAGGLSGSALGGLVLATNGEAEGAVAIPTAPAVDFFLVIPGIPGGSLDDHFKGAFDLLDWSFGATTSIGPTNTGGGVAKVRPQSLVFVKRVDQASPTLFRSCCTGKHFPSVRLTARKHGTGVEFLHVTIRDVYLSSYRQALGSVDAVPLDVVGLDYGAFEMSFKPQNPDGSLGADVTVGFDFIKNKVL